MRALMGLATLVAAGAAAAEEPVVIDAVGREVTLGQLAHIPQGFEHLSERVVAQLPGVGASLRLSEAQVAAILRREAPLLELEPRFAGPIRISASGNDPEAMASDVSCHQLAVAVPVGEYLSSADLVSAPCRDTSAATLPLIFDSRVGSVRATAELPAGTHLGRLALGDGTVVPEAARVIVQARSGPVIVEREALTMQPARAGSEVFVQTNDGKVVAVTLSAEPL